MRFLRQSLSGLLMLALSLGLLLYAGQVMVSAIQARIAEEQATPARKEREYVATLMTAETRRVTPILTAYGEVQSRRTLEIRAKSAGTLMQLSENFENGGIVEAGQLLAQVDPSNAEFALSRAESELKDSQSEQREAERALVLARDELAAAVDQSKLREKAFQRQLDLETRGVGTAAAVEVAELSASQARQTVIIARKAEAAAEARLDQAESRITRSQIAFDEATRNLSDTKIYARFSGTLSDVNVVEGGLVSVNEKLGRVVDGSALEVSFRVSTAQYARLTDDRGQLVKAPIRAVLSTFGEAFEFDGQISRASAAVGENQIGRVIFARLNEAPSLKPGDFVTVEIEEPALSNVARLPASSLDSDNVVLVLKEDSRLQTLSVDLLRRQGDDVLVRAEGLDGAQVLVDRSPLLGVGVKVVPFLAEPDEFDVPASELLEISEERRERLIAFVRSGLDASEEIKARLLGQLQKAQVPAELVERLERRIGG